MQRGVFDSGLHEDRDVGVCISPQPEEILVGGAGPFLVFRQYVSSPELQACEGARWIAGDDSAMRENFFEFNRGFPTAV